MKSQYLVVKFVAKTSILAGETPLLPVARMIRRMIHSKKSLGVDKARTTDYGPHSLWKRTIVVWEREREREYRSVIELAIRIIWPEEIFRNHNAPPPKNIIATSMWLKWSFCWSPLLVGWLVDSIHSTGRKLAASSILSQQSTPTLFAISEASP